jgi:single-strand DNA-binding protein
MVNKVILVGNVGCEPMVRYLEGGVPVANFTFATRESYRNKHGERVDQTEWHSVVVWRGLAQVVENFVKKGMQLYLEGKIRSRTWEDQNGIKHSITEIYADTMQILSRKRENVDEPAQAPTPASTVVEAASPVLNPASTVEEAASPVVDPASPVASSDTPAPAANVAAPDDDDLPF